MVNIKTMTTSLVCLCFILAGCGKSGTDDTKLPIKNPEQEKSELKIKVDELNRKIEVLGVEHQQLEARFMELGEWADRMVTGFGPGIWYVQDLKYPVFIKPMKTDDTTVIIDELNRHFKKDNLPEVLFLEQEGSTVVVGVSDDDLLTRKMGTFGAESYINAVVFTLASLKSVTCVRFKFEEGDHAVPGTYCRRLVFKE